MKKSSANISKALLALLVSVGTKALAQNSVVTVDVLVKSNLPQQNIQELINEEILLKTQSTQHFILNNEKVAAIINESGDQELIQFMQVLQDLAADSSKVSIKKLNEMILSTQDRGGLQKF